MLIQFAPAKERYEKYKSSRAVTVTDTEVLTVTPSVSVSVSEYDSGSELMLANWLLEEAGVPADNGTRRVVADSIRLLVKRECGTTKDAADYILEAVKKGEQDGDTINRFWFADRKYQPQKPKKSERQKRIESWEPSE